MEGLKVIDLCRSYPPAFAAMILADYQAEVIKVDPPGYRFPIPMKGGTEAFSAFYALDRNKKSLSLNLKSEQGREIFFKLAKQADVIIENSKPGSMEKLGIGYLTIRNLNPRIIYCSVSGYGQDGPYKMYPGHDSNYLALSGILDMIGEKGGPPVTPSNLIADMAGAGVFSLTGILMALLAREKTGKGQFIDISYTDAVFSLLSFETAMYFLTGIAPRRGETFRTGSEPCYASYKTKDGKYFNIACVEPRLWENLCRALDLDQLIPYQWPTDEKKRKEVFSLLRRTFIKKTRNEWWEWVKDKDIGAAPVSELEEAFNDPQLVHRKMIIDLDHPNLGKVKQVGFPFKLSDAVCKFRNFAPIAGQDTTGILNDLGYGEKEINELKALGVI
ncbi:MAG: CoA transferase [Methanomassiliicoccales archaeon]|nr:MAG: CoA transferase [Methanomassiliicoccales archaeon]